MALTPEDVVNKRFQPTKFREGYDQDEVDDFLDEVVVELRRLNQENEELKQRLVASESRIAELQRSGGQGGAAAAPSVDAAELARLKQENEELKQRLAAEPAAAPAYAASAENDPNSTNNLLQLARRLHEEHVKEGLEKRDSLVAEGHATAARIVAEAESKQRAQISSLDQERSLLEHRIDELRTFEREYRQKLKGLIEGQLRDLDTSSVAGTGSYAAAPAKSDSNTPAPVGAGQGGSSSVPAPVSASGGGNGAGQDKSSTPPTFQAFGG